MIRAEQCSALRIASLFSAVWIALLSLTPSAVAITPWTLSINTNNILVITNTPYNAVGDGVMTNTTAIQNAINAATAGGITNGLRGGIVEIPPGIYLCGPLTFKSSVNLQIDSGAILRMLPFGQYPVTWFTNGGTNIYFTAANFISGSSLTNIAFTGSGMIQGLGEPWWPWANTNGAVRPVMLALSGCNRTLVQGITLSNSPMFHIAFSGSANTTVSGVTVRANSSSDPVNPGHNTDACDVSGTNILVRDCDISVGDDNYTCGGNTSDVLITNNVYGNGHGVSIGSYTSPFVANFMVVNCSFTGTDQGIRIKSDRDRGGYVHNLQYLNLTMTNVMHPILIYTEYTNTTSAYRAVDSISPAVAASYPSASVSGTTPRYADILISNVTATAQSSRAAGLIWGLPEMSISNLTLIKVNLTGSKTFGIYDAKNVRIIDCTHNVPGGVSQFSFFNSDVMFSNSTPAANTVTLDGATTNGIANSFSFYNFLATLKNTNALDLGSDVTLGAATFTVSNNLALSLTNALSFLLGTNPATLAVKGNLLLGGTNNFFAGGGFTNSTYTLMTYTGTLSGSTPAIGSAPAGFVYAYDTSTTGQVRLVVTTGTPPPTTPTNLVAVATNSLVTLTWSPSGTATNYNVKRATSSGGSYTVINSTTATNYSDTTVASGVTYFYVITAVNAGGESTNSAEVAVTTPTPLVFSDLFASSTVNSASPTEIGRAHV